MTNSEREMENKPEDGVYVYVSIISITSQKFDIILLTIDIERFHSRRQQRCTFTGSVYMKKLPQGWFWTPTWPSLETPLWLSWRHVQELYGSKPNPIVAKTRHVFPRLAPFAWFCIEFWLACCIRSAFDWSDVDTFVLDSQSQICSVYGFFKVHFQGQLLLVLLVGQLVYSVSVLIFFRVCFWKELVGTETTWWCLNLFLKFCSMLCLWYPFW